MELKEGSILKHNEDKSLWEIVRFFGPWPVARKIGTKVEVHIPPDMAQYWTVLATQETWGTHQ